MTATEEMLVRVEAGKEVERSVRRPLRPWRCFVELFRKPCCVERAVIEQLYLVELATGQLLQQQIQPLASEHLQEEARRICSMVTCLLAFLRHPEQLAHYARLGQICIENRTYGICVSSDLVLLSVIRGNAGLQMRLVDCREMLMDAQQEYANGRRGSGEWLATSGGRTPGRAGG
ncbi:MAG: hypothetical protein FWD61_16105 [Phycisphaerales bacterium]|nr:hypothetical protein [Phycisphaerales bacterium]